VAGAVPNLSLQIIWHKHLRKSSCPVSYSHPLLWLGLCWTQPAEYWVQLCLCPHRLLLLCSPHPHKAKGVRNILPLIIITMRDRENSSNS
jgi:hypothetical protein